MRCSVLCFFFFQAEDGIRDLTVTGVQTCALPIFDQVELLLLRDAQRVGRQHDPELRAGGVDHADLAGADVVVDSRLLFDLSYATPPGRRASPATRATNASRGTAACGAPSPRGATVLAAASRSPTTAMTGTFSTCASRTL